MESYGVGEREDAWDFTVSGKGRTHGVVRCREKGRHMGPRGVGDREDAWDFTGSGEIKAHGAARCRGEAGRMRL